jgi:hypothetical protein
MLSLPCLGLSMGLVNIFVEFVSTRVLSMGLVNIFVEFVSTRVS